MIDHASSYFYDIIISEKETERERKRVSETEKERTSKRERARERERLHETNRVQTFISNGTKELHFNLSSVVCHCTWDSTLSFSRCYSSTHSHIT